MNLTLSDILSITAVFQIFVFVIFLLKRKKSHLSNYLMAIFLILQAIVIINFLVYHLSVYSFKYVPHAMLVFFPYIWLVAPVLHFYVLSICKPGFTVKINHAFHTLPFLLLLVWLMITFYFNSIEEKLRILASGQGIGSMIFWDLSSYTLYLQFFIYNVFSFRAISSYRKQIKENYSSLSGIYLRWLKVVLTGFMISWLINLAANLMIKFSIPLPFSIEFIPVCSFFVLFNYMYYKAWTEGSIFSGEKPSLKYQYSKLSLTDASALLKKLLNYMDDYKPWMDPELTLAKLAEDISISPRYLSQLINEHRQVNFYDFISRYRVEASKLLLGSPDCDKTILEVLYEVGFNTKSSFNTAFKKFTGTTPTHYRLLARRYDCISIMESETSEMNLSKI